MKQTNERSDAVTGEKQWKPKGYVIGRQVSTENDRVVIKDLSERNIG